MHDWDDHYRAGSMPWDVGHAEPLLAERVARGHLPRGRAIEVGCGTGTDARFLADSGWEVMGVDLAPTAVELARSKGGGVSYEVHDILAAPLPGGPYDLVFDRGCFHVFDAGEHRRRFAERVAEALAPGGCWLSIAGSTEGPARDVGPPRRSARDLMDAIEPVLELLELRSASFAGQEGGPAAWSCLSRRRVVPAQPSTRR
ncbi:MAG: class I SAM-dependent methyltransferase [Myxococcales bacterium]|nr:class I SAM-dependent methyltransferase [Myxococcales bacterium]